MKKTLKIVIAPDSFKGSISAQGAAKAIQIGLLKGAENRFDLHIQLCPIADGGEGTLEALVGKAQRLSCSVKGPDAHLITAEYGYLDDVAVIEMARAAGLTLLEETARNATHTTTFGVGELILDALNRGFRKLLLTVGGSATNDGGCGMLAALGAKFKTKDGSAFIPTGITLDQIDTIDLLGLDPRLYECEITVATDVKNPLCGEHGATAIYAPQKGAQPDELIRMESGMRQYEKLLAKLCGKEIGKIEGCGAGGGIAAPLLAFCHATIRSGIDAVLDAVRFEERICDADVLITGEGKLDRQSLFGKAISGITDVAKKAHIPVVCFVGCVGDDITALKAMGIQDVKTLSEIAVSLEDSISNASTLLQRIAFDWIQERF